MAELSALGSTPGQSSGGIRFRGGPRQVSPPQILGDVMTPATNQTAVQQQQQQVFSGYVTSVQTSPGLTWVLLTGQYNGDATTHNVRFVFPPNDPTYLNELLRAMNHPHMKVEVSFINQVIDKSGMTRGIISWMTVFMDWDPLHPAFLVRLIN